MSEVSERIALLSKERRALFQALLASKGADAHTIPRCSRSDSMPMSYAQQRLWFIDQLDPGNPAYNCPVPVRLEGRLQVGALARSLNALVRRHEILRTTYGVRDGEPVQIINEHRQVPLPVVDLTSLGRPEQESAVRRSIQEDADRSFDLATGPVIRAQLMRVGPEEHVLLVDIHHIANDHWSIRVFFQELAEGYNDLIRMRRPGGPELPVQYADYALWQRARLQGAVGEEHLSFWRENLSGLTSVELPADHTRQSVLSHRGGLTYLRLPPPLVSELRAIGRVEGATLFMTLLAGFNVLLARYCGQTDVSVGCSVTGRDRPELEGLIGFFVNTIVLRADLSDDPTFRELVRRTRVSSLGAYAHSEYPFDLLVQELNPQRAAGRIPLVPVMFTLDDTPDGVPHFEGLQAAWVEPKFTTTKFDLLVSARPSAEGIYGHVQYSRDLFEPDTIERLVGHYRTLLEAAAASPDCRVSTLPLLPEQERHQLLVEWNVTAAPFPDDTCLHELFEAQARQHGEAPALLFGDGTLSYADLNVSSNRLAHHLRRLGVGPEVAVAILLERSPEFVVAVLAVLKAGGAYVPLDPSYPSGQLSSTLRGLGASVLLTRRSFHAEGERGPTEVIYVDEIAERLADEPPDNPGVGVTPENLAYVICTSGSTGAPKGIALRHRGVVNNLVDLNERFGVGYGDRVLFLSSPSFDMSVYETLGVLGACGALLIPDPGAARDPSRWLELMVRHGVTLWNSAPVLLELLVEQLEQDGGPTLPSLRLALLGGDWIPMTLPDRLRAFAPNVRVISLGGATEASIHSTIYPVEATDPNWASIPYGRPMANQRAYILDGWQQPVPVGVPGELHLAGVGLARGYLNRAELTAEKFIEHSFYEGQVERLFKTGDLARWRRDGVIELLGRKDFQVKINGLRVELGEVESALLRHEAVRDAAVVAANDGRRGKLLAAFFVPRRGRAVTAGELREHLAQIIPSYMIPSVFTPLARLPTSNNGKVDRRALSVPEPDMTGDGPTPQDEVEERIVSVWRAVLGIGDFGIDDNFFDLGGDSFKAIRAVRRMGAKLPLVELFKNPTVRALASYLRMGHRHDDGMLYLLTPPSRRASVALVCVPYGGGNAAAYQPLADLVPSHFALWSVSLPGHDPGRGDGPFVSVEEAARRCCEEVVERVTGPVVVYGQCAGASVAVALARRLEERGHEVRAVYAGAALPDTDPETSLRVECSSSDEELYQYLRSLGGFDGALDWADEAEILKAVRHDLIQNSKFFEESYGVPLRRLAAPLRCLVGDQDIATANFETGVRGWELFAARVELITLPGAGHYFVKHQAAALAALLARRHPDGM